MQASGGLHCVLLLQLCGSVQHAPVLTSTAVQLCWCSATAATGDVKLCSAASGWAAPAVAGKTDKKKKKGKSDGGDDSQQQQQQQQNGDAKELDPEKAAKKVRPVMMLAILPAAVSKWVQSCLQLSVHGPDCQTGMGYYLCYTLGAVDCTISGTTHAVSGDGTVF